VRQDGDGPDAGRGAQDAQRVGQRPGARLLPAAAVLVDQRLALAVELNAVGLEADGLARLVRPFQRLARSRARRLFHREGVALPRRGLAGQGRQVLLVAGHGDTGQQQARQPQGSQSSDHDRSSLGCFRTAYPPGGTAAPCFSGRMPAADAEAAVG
jgi:hypothetical protein